MRRLVYGAVVSALLGLGAPAALAADSYEGGCKTEAIAGTFAGIGQPSQRTGVLRGAFAAVDDALGTPLVIDATCWVQVDGVRLAETELDLDGTGTAANARDVSFWAEASAVIELCWEIAYGTSHDTRCSPLRAPVRSPVVGYIAITQVGSGSPMYTAQGALADPASWSCTDNGTATPYRVTCRPMPGVLLDWRCDLLHADIQTASVGAVGRTSLDCDGTGPPEAQTSTVSGSTGRDSVWAQGTTLVTAFSCTVDDGAGGAALPDFRAGCGDPGAPTAG